MIGEVKVERREKRVGIREKRARLLDVSDWRTSEIKSVDERCDSSFVVVNSKILPLRRTGKAIFLLKKEAKEQKTALFQINKFTNES